MAQEARENLARLVGEALFKAPTPEATPDAGSSTEDKPSGGDRPTKADKARAARARARGEAAARVEAPARRAIEKKVPRIGATLSRPEAEQRSRQMVKSFTDIVRAA